MSRTAHTLRLVLQCTRKPAMLHVAALGLACAAAHTALPATAAEAESVQRQPAQLQFKSCAKPQYPQADLQACHEGTVTIGFLVDATGRVLESNVAASSGFTSLDEAARTALATCSFQPALERGKPVQQWTTVKYVWTLR
jgi:protein TonB